MKGTKICELTKYYVNSLTGWIDFVVHEGYSKLQIQSIGLFFLSFFSLVPCIKRIFCKNGNILPPFAHLFFRSGIHFRPHGHKFKCNRRILYFFGQRSCGKNFMKFDLIHRKILAFKVEKESFFEQQIII